VPLFRLLVATALVLLIALPTSALAGTRRAKSPVTLASSIAARYWGAMPCQGKIKILTRRRVPVQLEHDSDGWVTFDSSLGANDLASPAGTYRRCTIALGRSRWPTTASMRQDWDMLCMTMIHEFGHLLGRSHDATTGSVMAAVFTDYTSEPRLCRTHRPKRPRR